MKKKTVLAALTLIIVFAAGCAPKKTPVESTFAVPAPLVTATIPSPLPEPTATLTPAPLTGSIEGVVKDGISGNIVSGAAIILCKISAETEEKCVIDSSLIAVTGQDGKFTFSDLSHGSYMILYNPLGEPETSWQVLNDKELDLSSKNWKCLLDVYRKLGTYPDCADFQMFNIGAEAMFMPPKELLEPFTGKEGEMLVIPTAASFISREYGLQLDFYNGKPFLAVVEPGKTTSVEVKAWKAE